MSPPITEPHGLAEWIASVPAKEKDALLARVAHGEGAQVQAQLLRGLREASGSPADWTETRRPQDYDLAVSLLRDLRTLADRQEGSAAFRERFLELRAQHQRKPSLLERFDQAGLAG